MLNTEYLCEQSTSSEPFFAKVVSQFKDSKWIALLLLHFTLGLSMIHGQVVINEVMLKPNPALDNCVQTMAHSTSPNCGNEYIELYNTDPCNPIDLSCYFIGNSGFAAFNIGAFVIPNGTILQPLSHLVIGGPNASADLASIDIVLNNFVGTPNLCLNGSRWFLENNDGWVGLYAPDGTPVDAVYWTFSANQASKINTSVEFDRDLCVPSGACQTGVTLVRANQIPAAVLSYAGESPSVGFTLSRIPDGGAWQRNVAPSINNTTVGNCNGGSANCATPQANITPSFSDFGPYCSGASIPNLPTTSLNGISGTWAPAINNTETTTYVFTPNPNQCASEQTLTITINEQQPPPIVACYQNAVWNETSCQWDITGSQPSQPVTSCNEIAIFNDVLCSWEIIQGQPPMPTLACYESATWNEVSCQWDITGSQPSQPVTSCNETAIFNNTLCSWEIIQGQPPMPTLACYESATWNEVSCQWDITGSQPSQPTTACYQTATWNSVSCEWEVTGFQPNQPSISCYQSATWNANTCQWDVLGNQPVQPNLSCYEIATWNQVSCSWDIEGTQPQQPNVDSCAEFANWNPNSCQWELIPINSVVASFTYSSLNSSGGNSIQLINTSQNATNYQWFYDNQNSQQTNPNLIFNNAGFYEITLVASNNQGCSDTTSLIVEIIGPLVIYVPNTFTPDDKSVNNVFKPILSSGFDPYHYELLIFNRWGEIMFESKNAEIGWDGTYGGKVCQDGVYIWQIRVKNSQGIFEELRGHINLLK